MEYEVIYGTKQAQQVAAMFGQEGSVSSTHPEIEFILVLDQWSESLDIVLRPACAYATAGLIGEHNG